jgi:hypothetical protein
MMGKKKAINQFNIHRSYFIIIILIKQQESLDFAPLLVETDD